MNAFICKNMNFATRLICLVALFSFLILTHFSQKLTRYYHVTSKVQLTTQKEILCEGTIPLHPYQDFFEDKIFMLETSEVSQLSSRQGCAVESAARTTNIPIIIMLLSPTLNLADNVTCQIYKTFQGSNVFFHQIVLEYDLQQTPILGLYKHGSFDYSKHKATHISDALRFALLLKYGGWYADLDFVFLQTLESHWSENIIVYAQSTSNADSNRFLLNGILRFKKDHPLPFLVLKAIERKYEGIARGEIGQPILMQEFKQLCRGRTHELILNASCHNITVLNPQSFIPIPGYEISSKWRVAIPLEPSEWNKTFRNALAAHFYSGTTQHKPLRRDPSREPYSYLAEIYCPLSYRGSKSFD